MAETRRFLTSIGASALLHFLVLAALIFLITNPKKPAPLPQLEVDLSSLPLPAAHKAPARAAHPSAPTAPQQEAKQAAPPPVVLPQHQIVDPSDSGEEKVPKETTLLSDRNNSVPEEMVHKGDKGHDENATEGRLAHEGGGGTTAEPPQQAAAPVPPAAVPPPPRPKEVPKPVAPKAPPPKAPAARRDPGDGAERLAALPSLDKLLPSAAAISRDQPLPDATPQSQRSGRDLLNSGGAPFSGRPGTRDLLPRVREGNVTMLNTKADLFAPFVRRVAGRVFENLDLAFSSMRYQRGLGSGRATATVEAIMDRNGKFVGAHLTDNSGSSAVGVDRILLGSATADTFFDANPPPGAEAADGKIHFVLLVDLMVDTVPDPRTGRSAVSYYGVAGVGLK